MNLYVVRHGETDMGKNKLIATVDEPLNRSGIQQAINLGNELKGKNIDITYCSPIFRARHTLELFNLDQNIPVVIDDRIKERDMGVFEGVSFNSLEWEKFWGIDSEVAYSQLESMKNVYKRVSDFLDEIKLKKDKNILIVTHGGILIAVDWYFNGFTNSLLKCKNCKIYKYNIDKKM